MKNLTISLWINTKDEMQFLTHLENIVCLPLSSNGYTWEVKDIIVSKSMMSNSFCINIPFMTYLKFKNSFIYNGGNIL